MQIGAATMANKLKKKIKDGTAYNPEILLIPFFFHIIFFNTINQDKIQSCVKLTLCIYVLQIPLHLRMAPIINKSLMKLERMILNQLSPHRMQPKEISIIQSTEAVLFLCLKSFKIQDRAITDFQSLTIERW